MEQDLSSCYCKNFPKPDRNFIAAKFYEETRRLLPMRRATQQFHQNPGSLFKE